MSAVYCARDLELPIPQPPPQPVRSVLPKRGSGSVWPRRARDALFHLLTYGALYTWVTSLVLLLFTYLDFAFPDPAWKFSQARINETYSIIRAQLAIVIVAFPIFLVLWHYLLREVRLDSEKAKGGIRRWLGYLAVFVGALTMSGDVITLVYLLLEGHWTFRLLLKTAVLFLISGSLVLYLAMTLRIEREAEECLQKST